MKERSPTFNLTTHDNENDKKNSRLRIWNHGLANCLPLRTMWNSSFTVRPNFRRRKGQE